MTQKGKSWVNTPDKKKKVKTRHDKRTDKTYPSITYRLFFNRIVGAGPLQPIPAMDGWGWGTSWTVHQSIAGPNTETNKIRLNKTRDTTVDKTWDKMKHLIRFGWEKIWQQWGQDMGPKRQAVKKTQDIYETLRKGEKPEVKRTGWKSRHDRLKT